jgi:hypothetical protein
LQNGQPKVVVRMEMGNVDMGDILSRFQQSGCESMGIAQGKTCVNQNGILRSVEQRRRSVKTDITMLKNLVIQWHIESFLQLQPYISWLKAE